MTGTPKPEPLVMAKELTSYFEQQGVHIGYGYARALIRACPLSIRGRFIRPSEAWSWWVLNPDFAPYSEKDGKLETTAALCGALTTGRVERGA